MYSLLFLGFVSFLLSLILTPLARNVFRKFGLVDKPDSKRKLHKQPVPQVGGVVIILSYTLAFGLLLLAELRGGASVSHALPFSWKLLPAAGLMFVTGLLDDVVRLSPLQKLAGQITAATAAYVSGIHIHAMGGHSFHSWWSLPLTVLWLVACANALNLVDGLDGLAAGIGLLATTTSLLAALMQHNIELAFATLPLAGALLGFLRYNFNPATVFLGDSGSLFIGFMLGCYGVLWSQKSATILGMAAPVIALSIPLLDTSLAIARRFLRRQPILSGDRGHIHHRLLDRGLTPRRVVLLLYGVCALSSILSLLMANNHHELVVIATFCVLVYVGIQRLGYVEFDIARRMLLEGWFRRFIGSQISLRNLESSLSLARTPEECWSVLKETYRGFGFYNIQLELAGRSYTETADSPRIFKCWRLDIPLSPCDYVHLAREFGPNLEQTLVSPFADVVHRVLESKLASFVRPQIGSPADLIRSEAVPESWHAISAEREYSATIT
jgi:UDP-GlcNAc:undecaprenyl-phosphate GlcNAc-1-phosphate transferase